MVAMPTVDLLVTGFWIGALVVVLLAQGVRAWYLARQAARYASEAGRLADAIHEPPAAPSSVRLASPAAEPEPAPRATARTEA